MFTITTYKEGNKGYFYIQSKGLNAGQVLKEPIKNCFAVDVLDVEKVNPIFLWYYFQNIYNMGAYKPELKGSVIPYITKESIEKIYHEFSEKLGF